MAWLCAPCIALMLGLLRAADAGCVDDGICYVTTGSSASNDCSSLAAACPTIAAALTNAGSNSDVTIRISPGTYAETTHALSDKSYTFEGQSSDVRDTTILEASLWDAGTQSCSVSIRKTGSVKPTELGASQTAGQCIIMQAMGGVAVTIKDITIQAAERAVTMYYRSYLTATNAAVFTLTLM